MKQLSVVLFLFCVSAGFCQSEYEAIFGDSLKEISLTCGIAYLPSPNSETFVMKANKSKVTARYHTYKIRKRYRRVKSKKVKMSKEEFCRFYRFFSLQTSNHIKFTLSKQDKDSLKVLLKEKAYGDESKYKVSPELLDKYLKNNLIRMDKSVFAKDSLSNLSVGIVIDGAPFRFTIQHISVSNDTITDYYSGNLFGGNRFRDLPKYLMYASIYQQTKLYHNLPFQEYFSRSNMLRVVLRYIEVNEGLVAFKPFELKLEEK